jgi:hypothetical protein
MGIDSALQVMLQIPKDCENVTSEWVARSTKEDDYEIKCTTTCTNDHGVKANSTVAIDFTLDEVGSLTCIGIQLEDPKDKSFPDDSNDSEEEGVEPEPAADIA